MRTAYLTALAIASSSAVLVSGCKKKERPSLHTVESLAELSKFRDKMCACKDTACADNVHEQLTALSKERVAKAGSGKRALPDDALMKKLLEVSQQYSECKTKAKPPDAGVVDAAVPVDAYPSDIPPRPANPSDIATTVREAIQWARDQRKSAIARVEYRYVDKDGLIDTGVGELWLTFGIESDPTKRRTGAPAKLPASGPQCLSLRLQDGAWVLRDDVRCTKALPSPPRCSVTDLWKRALADGAPADAVAVLDLNPEVKPTWRFTIDDPERGVNFSRMYADDCPIVVETP